MTNYLTDFINLKDIRSLLEETFGSYSKFYIIYELITRVQLLKNDEEYQKKIKKYFSTMGVDIHGTLFVSEEFLDKYLTSIDDLKLLLTHELLHIILGDTKHSKFLDPKDPELDIKLSAINISADMRINSFIHFFADRKGIDNSFFNKFYDKLFQEKERAFLLDILRSKPKFLPDELSSKVCKPIVDIHNKIYGKENSTFISFQEIYNHVLEYLRENKVSSDLLNSGLLGNHSWDPNNPTIDAPTGQGEDEDTDGNDLKELTEEEVSDILNDMINDNPKGKRPGYSEAAFTNLLKDVQELGKLNIDCFKRMSFDSLFANIRLYNHKKVNRRVKMPKIPGTLYKKDMFLLMHGAQPILWDVQSTAEVKQKKMLPIYLDVSGSMWHDLPGIIKLITNIDDTLEYIWGFSNKIYKHTIEDLRENKIKSTGGTDFDCIIDHAQQNDYKELVVITDGEAYCNKKQEKLESINDVILVLCGTYRNKDNWFSKVYENTLNIEDVTIN